MDCLLTQLLFLSVRWFLFTVYTHSHTHEYTSTDFSHLYPKTERRKNRAGVLNGISISQDPDVLYITGKNWDKMFLIKLLF